MKLVIYLPLKLVITGLAGADPGFFEGGVRIRGESRREELTLVLYH